jgi:hypothetical protein
MKSFKQIVKETVNPPKSEDEKRFLSKHMVAKSDHPNAEDDQFTSKKKKDKSRDADHQPEDDQDVYEEVEQIDEKVYAADYDVGYEKSQFGGYRPHVTNKKTGKTMYLGQTSYKEPEHAKGHAAAYLKGYEQMGDRTASRMGNEYEKANKKHVYKEEVEQIEENFKPGSLKLRDGSTVKLSSKDAMTLNSLFVTLNDKNQEKMDQKMMANKKGFEEILAFAKEAV